MKLLLDTHLLVWLLIGDDRIGRELRACVEGPANTTFASVISIWEVAVKWPLRRGGPGDMPFPARVFADALVEAGIEILDSRPAHAAALDDLAPHHADPFDRLLVATAGTEGMILITCDAALAAYGDSVRVF